MNGIPTKAAVKTPYELWRVKFLVLCWMHLARQAWS